MAMLEIDDDMRNAATEAFDDLLSPDVFGKLCRLTYPSVFEACANCIGNVWKTGGPMPYQQGMCPLCGGAGQRASVNTADIYLSIDWGGSFGVNNRVWSSLIRDGNTRLPDTLLQTRGFGSDLMKVRQCDSMTVIEPGNPMMTWNFKLANEPYDYFAITQARYFIAFWKRAG